ncbi:phosphosulfolactate synthase [Alicyclobacillus acidoterrestris]|uniref:Phosphosulfolactate synthase n=1 Tax=Alicyclobacillus acidoterrestris (strain ATCC 49025 / DSM 3922 / CIP 106132 / NCIMB 13137 / GD3B) TaxID=1356854 RepID=T0C9M3_ALIAG|nr:phosphosulfolactate synthase [Alicyclobacillus acidoterrestris]EPZ52868.1 hypothetical protein N007_19130 [Alicyclobacillus acidoterrestris ATCC 49025]UNO48863.1 phosphosulfolactate synthase [Alicyclobacillus acidoterrestris]
MSDVTATVAFHGLDLPKRAPKPRTTGWTVLIDNGVPMRFFEDVIASAADYIDLVKFGWGTAIVSPVVSAKIDCLRAHDVDFYFGGTLFEKFYIQGKLDAYHAFCQSCACRYVEVSNGTIPLSNRQKSELIHTFAKDFYVLSEVGHKDAREADKFTPTEWLTCIQEDLEAGAYKVITESRESGTSGICQADGTPRTGIVKQIQASGIHADQLIFEAPTKSLQTYFIERFGTNVCLGNIPMTDVISLETLRLGLRSDTFMHFESLN